MFLFNERNNQRLVEHFWGSSIWPSTAR